MAGFWDIFSDGSMLQTAAHFGSAIAHAGYGNDLQAASEFEAQQLRQQGGEAQASAQRQAFMEERHAKYVASAALASAAASGGGASDPTVINIIAEIAQEGVYRQKTALYQGDERARMLQMQAAGREFSGESAKRAQYLGAIGEVMQGFASPERGEAVANARKTYTPTSLLSAASGDTFLSRYRGDGPPNQRGGY